jgi:uncharacterized protein YbjQ (UPF0145 family)
MINSDDSSHPGAPTFADSGIPAPELPVIKEHEQLGLPFPIVDGLPRTLGWQFRIGEKPAFVIASRGRMGGLKVVERFPLTGEGWAQAWRVFAASDPAAAARVGQAVTARNAAARNPKAEPQPDTVPILIVTTNEVPGHQITDVHGDVFGLIVRARNYFSNLGASFRTLAGGEVAGYTKLLTDSRNQARERMWQQARAKGANAVVAMRFDCNEIGDIMSEVAAYGTAVTVEPIKAASETSEPSVG